MIWSSEAYLILGYEPFTVKPSYDFFLSHVHPEDRQFLNDNVKAAWYDKKPYSVDVRVVLQNKTQRICNATAKVEYDNNDKPLRTIGTFQDISERKKMENEIIIAKQKAEDNQKIFYNLFNNLQSGVAIYEVIDNGRDFIFQYFNKSGERIDKQKKEELIGKCIFEVRPDVERFGLISAFRKVLQTNEPFYLPVNIYKDDNLEGFYENYIFLLPTGELVAVFDDVTVQKKYQNELFEAKEKAEQANRLKSEFLKNMSHEIRTPMNGIIGFAEMLDETDLSEERRKYYSKIIQNSSFQLLKIIDEILEISTLETKQNTLDESQFCLNDLLMELFSVFSLKSNERGLPIYLKKPLKDSQSHIISDKTKLNKILSNLLENAILLNGNISVESKKGYGTTFMFQFHTNLLIIISYQALGYQNLQ